MNPDSDIIFIFSAELPYLVIYPTDPFNYY